MPGRIRLLGSFATAAFATAGVFGDAFARAGCRPAGSAAQIRCEANSGRTASRPSACAANRSSSKFVANEEVMKKAFETYNFTQSVRLDELTDPGGKFNVTGEVLHAAGWPAIYARHEAARFHFKADAFFAGGRAGDLQHAGISADCRTRSPTTISNMRARKNWTS